LSLPGASRAQTRSSVKSNPSATTIHTSATRFPSRRHAVGVGPLVSGGGVPRTERRTLRQGATPGPVFLSSGNLTRSRPLGRTTKGRSTRRMSTVSEGDPAKQNISARPCGGRPLRPAGGDAARIDGRPPVGDGDGRDPWEVMREVNLAAGRSIWRPLMAIVASRTSSTGPGARHVLVPGSRRMGRSRRQAEPTAREALEDAQEAPGGDDLGFLLANASQRWNELLAERFPAALAFILTGGRRSPYGRTGRPGTSSCRSVKNRRRPAPPSRDPVRDTPQARHRRSLHDRWKSRRNETGSWICLGVLKPLQRRWSRSRVVGLTLRPGQTGTHGLFDLSFPHEARRHSDGETGRTPWHGRLLPSSPMTLTAREPWRQ